MYEPPARLSETQALELDPAPTGRASKRARRASRSAGFPAAVPALVLLAVFFLFPVARFLGFSIEAGTLDWYAQALGKELYLRVLWDTFEIAALVTVFCLLLGYPLGFLIATTTPFWATVGFIFVLLPLWTSVLVRTYAWMVLLGRNGVLNRMLIDAGVITAPANASSTPIAKIVSGMPTRCVAMLRRSRWKPANCTISSVPGRNRAGIAVSPGPDPQRCGPCT